MVSKAARANLEAHIAGERARDVEALMAPMAENPSYVIPGWRLEGRAAVRAMYESLMPILNEALLDEFRRALDDPKVTRWGEDHCVLEYDDRYPFHRNMVVVVHFEGDKVKSENSYWRTIEQPRPPPSVFEGAEGVTPLRPTGPASEPVATIPAQLVSAYLSALQRQDADALCALVTDDFVLEVPLGVSGNNDPSEALAWRGIEDYRTNYAEHFPQMLTSQRLIDVVIRPTLEPDVVYAEFFGDMALTNGRPYQNRYVFRFHLRDGKICRLLEFCNPITAAIAFGQPLPDTSPG